MAKKKIGSAGTGVSDVVSTEVVTIDGVESIKVIYSDESVDFIQL